MDTLPSEMVQKISRHLTPQDLARCCAVSHKWRDIFDQNQVWKPHCNVLLDTPLRTSRSVVEPVFVMPEDENSTLSPICHWRRAFLRERHLWRNWKEKIFRREPLPRVEDEREIFFLTNNAIVRWFWKHVEVWDVSGIPATCVAKSESLTELGIIYCRVIGNSQILALTLTFAKVYHVDLKNKSIQLKHNIVVEEVINSCLEYSDYHGFCVDAEKLNVIKGSMLLHVTCNGFNMSIYDLEAGCKIKEEPCLLSADPSIQDESEKPIIFEIKSSPTCEDVLVGVMDPLEFDRTYTYYIYNLKEKLFLPNPIAHSDSHHGVYELHKHYIATGALPALKIVNYRTSEVLFRNEGQLFTTFPRGFKDSFIFLDYKDSEIRLEMFSLTEKTITTVYRYADTPMGLNSFLGNKFKIKNNSFAMLIGDFLVIKDTWEMSGQSLKRSDFFFPHIGEINQAFTRSLKSYFPYFQVDIYHHW